MALVLIPMQSSTAYRQGQDTSCLLTAEEELVSSHGKKDLRMSTGNQVKTQAPTNTTSLQILAYTAMSNTTKTSRQSTDSRCLITSLWIEYDNPKII